MSKRKPRRSPLGRPLPNCPPRSLQFSPLEDRRLLALDTSFDFDGIVTTSFATMIAPATHTIAQGVAVQQDDKIVVAGYSNVSGEYDFALTRYNAADGSLDSSFGNQGRVVTAMSLGNDGATSVAVQPDGKILAAGYAARNGQLSLALARFNTDGSLDSAFGTNGRVFTSLGGSAAGFNVATNGQHIVVAGFSGSRFMLARLTMSGALDATFGSGGTVVSQYASNPDQSYALAIQSDGKIVAGLSDTSASMTGFVLLRYLTNGSLDPSFGSNGQVSASLGQGRNGVTAVAVQSDGKIVAAGYSGSGTTITRYTTSGQSDSSFTPTSFPEISKPRTVALLSDGKIVVAGPEGTRSGRFAVGRALADGGRDTGFGNSGIDLTQVVRDDVANHLAVQSDGKIVAGGTAFDGRNYLFALTRYTDVVNSLPVANDDAAVVSEDSFVVIDVLANDFDSDGTLNPATVGGSGSGTSVNPTTGEITFTPPSNFNGLFSFNYTVRDNQNGLSNTATVNVNVTAVNDPPFNTVPGSQNTFVDTPRVFSTANSNRISISDVDAGPNLVSVTLSAVQGTLTLAGTSGLSFTTGDGTSDALMTFQGMIANINTALDGLSFQPNTGITGAASLSISTNDLGNAGAGGALSDFDTVNIQVLSSFVVINTNDSGFGSLRQAILNANATPGTDAITFNIPGAGLQTISPSTPLPSITDPVIIDGYTQPGSSPNSLAVGGNANLLVELTGALVIATHDTTVQGLLLNNALQISGDDNLVQGNYFGTNQAGTAPSSGGAIFNDIGGNNRIGGTTPAARNLIAGGVSIFTSDNVIEGNYIGIDASGTVALSSSAVAGVTIFSGDNNMIGGAAPGAGNVISGWDFALSVGNATNASILGNRIGTDATGAVAIGNRIHGVVVQQDTVVGGVLPGEANVIAFSQGTGVRVSNVGTGSSIRGNSIFSNGDLGIDLLSGTTGVTPNDVGDADAGANDLQNFPVLSLVQLGSSTRIVGTLNSTANTSFLVDFYENSSADPSGFGEGQRYLGSTSVTTNLSGDASFDVTLPVATTSGRVITATATDPSGNTSEFSQALGEPVSFVVTNTNDSGTGSLRAAITSANSTAGTDTITFSIPGAGLQTISPSTPLPSITDPVIIDGYTQPGSSPNSLAVGNNAVLLVEVRDRLQLSTNDSTIQGLLLNLANGLNVSGDDNLIQGNFIGTNQAGTASSGLGFGVFVSGDSNQIGGATPAARNLLSGLGTVAVAVTGDDNAISGNYIGVNAAGTAAVANAIGIQIFGGSNNLIGGDTAAERNIISGNSGQGIGISNGAIQTLIQGNYIGTNAAGTAAVGNVFSGIVNDGFSTIIGGDTAGERNVISGNVEDGILVTGASSTISGNFIGADAAGTAAIPNLIGIFIGAPNQTIGGTNAGEGNLISGNLQEGVQINLVSGNSLLGNRIGTDVSGTLDVGNGGAGIVLTGAPVNNQIGGVAAGQGNTIAFNGLGGVEILGGNQNPIRGNSIFANDDLGIDLNSDGVTFNDAFDPDTGPNNRQNFPDLSFVQLGASTRIVGVLDSVPGSTFTIDFYENSAADPSGFGEGQRYLGSTTVSVMVGSPEPFDVTLPVATTPGNFITATATDPINNTSEFSQAITQLGATFVVTNTSDSGAGSLRAAILNANATAGTDTITFNIPGAGLQTIAPSTPLPALTDSVVINGYSQPGSSPNSLAVGNDAVLLVSILDGLQISANNSTVQGLLLNLDSGLLVSGDNNIIRGNFIGTNQAGTATSSLGRGINVTGDSNVIGGPTLAARNLISGTLGVGVSISGDANEVQGNYIGVNAAGTAAVPNLSSGIRIDGADSTRVGGLSSAERNIVSANSSGVEVFNASSLTVIEGNYIGVNADGTAAVGMQGIGIVVDASANTRIGGNLAAQRNVVSGNVSTGIILNGDSSVVQGNYIGTDVAGTSAIANFIGIQIGATNNLIGGTTLETRNLISGNTFEGIRQNSGSGSFFLGNFIGTDVTGALDLGNGTFGINLSGGDSHTIGGVLPGEANVIAFNGSAGVTVDTLGNSIRGNSIFANDFLGIDLAGDDVTLNDPADPDMGANNLQNFPFLSLVELGPTTRIVGTLNSLATTTYTIDFYENTFADLSGFGEGERYLGSTTVTTNGTGDASFDVTLPVATTPGNVITATATDPVGNTSEFAEAASQSLSIVDYDSRNNTLTIAPGNTTAQITVFVRGDTDPEGDETFRLNFTSPDGATLGSGAFPIGTIFDDDPVLPPPAFSIGDARAFEEDVSPVTATFFVRLNRPAATDLTVEVISNDGTAASPGDYTPINRTLTFTAGQTIQVVTVQVQGDTADEDDETFTVNLLNPGPGAAISDNQGVGTIVDNDLPASPVATLSINDVLTPETNSGNTVDAVFTITLSAAQPDPVRVRFNTSDDTANDGSDYAFAVATITFDPGQTTQNVTVRVLGDDTIEPNETFFANLAFPSFGIGLADPQGQGTIANDDQFTLSIEDSEAIEGSMMPNAMVFPVTLNAPAVGIVTVQFSTFNQSAIAPGDYATTSGTLTFMPGEISQPIFVDLVPDTTPETDETFLVNLTMPSGAIIDDGQAVGTIFDDEVSRISLLNSGVVEGDSGTAEIEFFVLREGDLSSMVTARFDTSDNSATAGSDYTATSGTITFMPGVPIQFITVAVNGDTRFEDDETFFLDLSNLTGGASFIDPRGEGLIENDDPTPPEILFFSTASAIEGDSGLTPMVFNIFLSSPTVNPVTVVFFTSDITATGSMNPGLFPQFSKFDVDHDGFVSGMDLLLVLEGTREPDRPVSLVFSPGSPVRNLDMDGDGYVSAIDALLVAEQLRIARPPSPTPAAALFAAIADETNEPNELLSHGDEEEELEATLNVLWPS